MRTGNNAEQVIPSMENKTRKQQIQAVESYDRAMNHWHKIATLAELLENCGDNTFMGSETVSRTGKMILDESCQLQECLQELKP